MPHPTPTQMEIGKMLAVGMTAREIGGRIGRSYKTVEAQRTGLFRRAGVRNVVELTHWMIAKGHVEVLW